MFLINTISTTVLGDPQEKLPLPVGISDFCLVSEKYYYVDKTLLIKDFLNERPKVSLFARPHGFGKSLTMDMLQVFFEKTGKDTSGYFMDKKIWACGEKYQKYQGKYPVIFLSFSDVQRSTWADTYHQITQRIVLEFERHPELAADHFYQKIVSKNAGKTDYMTSLACLSQMLDECHGVAPIIIIDDYDLPIQQGRVHGFYNEAVLFLRNLLVGGLKDNRHLSYGFLSGVHRVDLCGLDNMKINSILDGKYSQYFGFTSNEVRGITRYYGVQEKYDEIRSLHGGYRFGETEIYNPCSVINYFCNNRNPVECDRNIEGVLADTSEEIRKQLNELLNGKPIMVLIDTGGSYLQKSNQSSFFSTLFFSGYLKTLRAIPSVTGDLICEVTLLNKDIAKKLALIMHRLNAHP